MTTQILFPHLAINVSDLKASLAFYKAFFDAEPVKVRAGYAKFELHHPPLNFSLNEVIGEAAKSDLKRQAVSSALSSLNHAGFQVGSTDDVLLIKARLTAAGLLTEDEMQTTCCYAVQDKTWMRDPDGMSWEIFVVLSDSHTPRGDSSCDADSTCCTPESFGAQASPVSIALPALPIVKTGVCGS